MNAPDWWIKACRKELMWDDSGRDIDPIAERLWKEIEQHIPEQTLRNS